MTRIKKPTWYRIFRILKREMRGFRTLPRDVFYGVLDNFLPRLSDLLIAVVPISILTVELHMQGVISEEASLTIAFVVAVALLEFMVYMGWTKWDYSKVRSFEKYNKN